MQLSPCFFERTQAAAVYHSSSYTHSSGVTSRRMGELWKSPAGKWGEKRGNVEGYRNDSKSDQEGSLKK